MENFLNTIQTLLNDSGDTIEIVDAGQPYKIKIINKGKIYNGLSDPVLPTNVYTIIHNVILNNPCLCGIYVHLYNEYGSIEAEERICWCMFGGFDSKPDIIIRDVASEDTFNLEIRPACAKCPYGKPFCKRFVIPLTDREQQCFVLMRIGLTDKEIANRLGISYNTIASHVQNALEKVRRLVGRPVTRAFVVDLLTKAGI